MSIKSQDEIQRMREGGHRLAEIMEEISRSIKPGGSAMDLDKLAERLVFANGGKPSFKNYGSAAGNPYPATICVSFNSEIVHGIPTENKFFKDGDIVSIDIGMEYQGLHTDMARTFKIGKVSDAAQKLISVTEQSFWEGLGKMGEGKRLSAYSKAVQEYVEKNGFSVVRNLVGHGVGKNLHEDPSVPNYYNRKYDDIVLHSGMTLALEPMVNQGTFETVLGKDGWVFVTRDGKLSAHYENTILIKKDGVEVLTVYPME